MATRYMQYRGAKVATSEQAVATKPGIASYRGNTYDPNKVKPASEVKHGMYRGSAWSK